MRTKLNQTVEDFCHIMHRKKECTKNKSYLIINAPKQWLLLMTFAIKKGKGGGQVPLRFFQQKNVRELKNDILLTGKCHEK